MQAVSLSSCSSILSVANRKASVARRNLVVRAEEPRVVREYREDDDKVINTPTGAVPSNPNSAYIDELPQIKRTEMSPEMKARLRQEYLSLGGSPNTAMGGNYFLYIILIISFLAVLSAALGYI